MGGVIGHMVAMDKYNIISNNFCKEERGAEKGIGAIESVCVAADDEKLEEMTIRRERTRISRELDRAMEQQDGMTDPKRGDSGFGDA